MPKPSIIVKGKSLQLKGNTIHVKELAESKDLEEWVVIHDFRIKEVNQIINTLAKIAGDLMVTVKKPTVLVLPKDDHFNSPEKA